MGIEEKAKKILQETNDLINNETPSTSKINTSITTKINTSITTKINTPVPMTSAVVPVLKKRNTIDEADYLTGPVKSVQRCRSDPRVSISQIFREIYQQINTVPNAAPLLDAVNSKKVN